MSGQTAGTRGTLPSGKRDSGKPGSKVRRHGWLLIHLSTIESQAHNMLPYRLVNVLL